MLRFLSFSFCRNEFEVIVSNDKIHTINIFLFVYAVVFLIDISNRAVIGQR